MSKLIILLRLALLVISFYGYLQWMAKKIKPEFSLGVIFSGIGSILFLAGILNLLQEAAWVILLGGVALAALSVKRKESPGRILSPGVIFFLVAAVFFGFLLYGTKFIHYDNFSHWSLATKVLIKTNRFPNFADKNFIFTSYPLGSASFIYYFLEISGSMAEWLQMYAQALLMTAMAAGFFAFGKKIHYVILASIGSVLLLGSNVNFVNLLVDTLLPMVALGCIAFCIYHKDSLEEKLSYLIPYAVFLVSIKNSGILFAVLILVYALYATGINKKNRITWAVLGASPLVSLLLWQKHVNQVFAAGLLSKHSMSLSNFKQVFVDKDSGLIQTVLRGMIEQTCSFSNPVIIILILGAFLWALWKYVLKCETKQMGRILVFAGVSYVVYQIGTFAMYLFTMPKGEAAVLAGYSRYHKTILIFVMGLILLLAMEGFRELQQIRWQKAIVAAVALVTLLCAYYSLSPVLSVYKRQITEGTERQKIDDLIAQHNIQPGQNYLILVSQSRNDGDYLFYMSRYLLNPNQLSIKTDAQLNEIDLGNTDYIIVFEETDSIKAYIEREFGSYSGPVVPVS